MKTIYHNGVIITGSCQQDMSTPPACLVVEQDLVAYVGNTDDPFVAKALAEEDTQKVNLEGRIILPGFIDGCDSLISTVVPRLTGIDTCTSSSSAPRSPKSPSNTAPT